jgi:hypothetical protein
VSIDIDGDDAAVFENLGFLPAFTSDTAQMAPRDTSNTNLGW